MSEREHMIIGLVRDLLGPRDGPFEKLPQSQDPRNEYVTGVLAPKMQQRDSEDVDANSDEQIEEVSDDEQTGTGEGVAIASPRAFSPALDPKSQPRSAGLSFVLVPDEPGQIPVIDICATWAHYDRQADAAWQRRPGHAILKGVPASSAVRTSLGDDVDLYMRVNPGSGHYRVSLYLINVRQIASGVHPTPADFLFQPQIRIHCALGRLAPVDTGVSQESDDLYSRETNELALLYRERPVLARGHLCGAIWKAIDPERPHETLPSPAQAPFAWTDRGLVSPEDQHLFSPADVRSEFLPCYPVQAPETAWSWSDAQPEFRPLILAEMWTAGEIHQYLDSLVNGYTAWINAQEQVLPELAPAWHTHVHRNLERCRQVAARMQEGINWLIQNEDVRLAFCFANKAIALQSQWARKGEVYPWRPFQLAFLLLNIAGLADPHHPDRSICDLLWFPTGGGKTEAYLGLAAFTLGLRRLRARRAGTATRGDRGMGMSVLSRYTLRLLTIQQFRRALGIITACEILRVTNLTRRLDHPIGWRPTCCPDSTQFLWGTTRFSAGMWVGGNVTPNILQGFHFPTPSGMQSIAGALEILRGVSSHGYRGSDPTLSRDWHGGRIIADGDPAQVLTCPVCGTLLSVPDDGLGPGQHTLHFVFSASLKSAHVDPSELAYNNITLDDVPPVVSHSQPDTHTLSITFTIAPDRNIKPYQVDIWWQSVISQRIPLLPKSSLPVLLAARPARPGYFLTTFTNQQKREEANNFEIFCPNPQCDLNRQGWVEQVPLNVEAQPARGTSTGTDDPGNRKWPWQDVPAFTRNGRETWYSTRMPIPACTVDEQIYHRSPSLVIATVDKFARLAFEPRAASLFGNVTHYHARWGYYREGCPPNYNSSSNTVARHPTRNELHVPVQAFLPPELIIQDELHLLEGPLGSMVGIYETAIDALCEQRLDQKTVRPKYISSSATVRQAEDQVQALFERRLTPFPPSAIRVDDRFFARTTESHPLDCAHAGRLYIGVSAPGKGAQTPIVRIWSALLQTGQERKNAGAGEELDAFWTLVGYFNALRELAGALALYRQDIPQRLQEHTHRRDSGTHPVELSSRASSLDLPSMLDRLEKPWSEDAVLATSMFGTGVDVNRLGLMVVHGQPKTTSAYIQATGRVGRQGGGLVVAFFRVSRPRDLDHHEFFTGYHRQLYRTVEPVTVTPFAPRARERCLGPLSVALLRQGRQIGGQSVSAQWSIEQRLSGHLHSEAVRMADHRQDPEVIALHGLFEMRAQKQPAGRRPLEHSVSTETATELDRWYDMAQDIVRSTPETKNNALVYSESTHIREPERSVVLGDAQHQQRELAVAFEYAPNSLRNVEETTQFQDGLAGQAVRRSQFITTYGPGAILESRGGPRLIPMLDKAKVFSKDRPMQRFEITDSRLSKALLQQARIVQLPSNAELHLPEHRDLYETLPFPAWALCPTHQILYNKYNRPTDDRACPKCKPFPHTVNQQNEIWTAVRKQAIRFVMACPEGHLDDVPWKTIIAHKKAACQPAYLLWRGSGSALRDSTIECPDCGGSINLGVAYGREWRCSGRYPERGGARVDCAAGAKMIQRGAANLYMPELYTSLTIPPADSRLYRILQNIYIRTVLESEAALTKDALLTRLKKLVSKDRVSENTVRELERFTESDISEGIYQIMNEKLPQDNRALRHQEFEALRTAASDGAPALQANTPGGPAQFEIVRQHVREYTGPGGHRLRVTPVSRLRVVMVQTGYRRLDPLQGNVVSIMQTNEHDGSSWYPGIELFGEGIYIDLAPSTTPDQAHFALEYARTWQEAWQDPAAYHQHILQPEDRDSLHPVFVWWHTLAHRIINALSIDSGYSSAAVRERVFIDINEQTGSASGGILLYTVQPAGDGTLGGMMALATQFDSVLRTAFGTIDSCSNDPLCAEETFGDHKYNGSACYACLLVSETSCEHRNTRLDRTLLKENLP